MTTKPDLPPRVQQTNYGRVRGPTLREHEAAGTYPDPSTGEALTRPMALAYAQERTIMRPLTQADVDALIKRAADAEDHLRREVASNQALIQAMDDSREGAVHTLVAEVADRDATIASLRAASAKLHDETVDIIKARDQTIADLQALLGKCMPPGYSVGNAQSHGFIIEAAEGHSEGSGPLYGGAAWAWNANWSTDQSSCGDADCRADAISAAWAHYHATADDDDHPSKD